VTIIISLFLFRSSAHKEQLKKQCHDVGEGITADQKSDFLYYLVIGITLIIVYLFYLNLHQNRHEISEEKVSLNRKIDDQSIHIKKLQEEIEANKNKSFLQISDNT